MGWRPRAGGQEPSARPLRTADLEQALALCAVDPVASVLAAVRLTDTAARMQFGAGGWGVFEGREMCALAWVGANVVPVSPTGRGLAALARSIAVHQRSFSSLVGDAPAVHTVWSHLAQAWPPPRQVRADQPSLTLTTDPAVAGDDAVRPALAAELDLVLPASVAMFTEEYGYSPLGSSGAYAARVRQLIAGGRTFVRVGRGPDGPRVEFKAEIGASALGVAQIQGVWTHPDLRGRGIGAAGTAAVARHAFALGARTVSLYVNDYNTGARAMYRRVGFDQVGSYATVVL
ncbi:DUF4081 domain-containing GNAT family N-acetyltransferase [Litorihabitans aurantiacus]|uniref:Acetyltransferase n=1 Tax=Litorihabitans aurantiacus TaxID=1930061 RepID=A0AA37XEH0_9MICO|nr:DUF4081 domain-containing GNAT family N-acetyltransferase [Litorihabitans aurantiacus]GMA31788.1 acetyltransferase [Litorihabitans aurantiacus]